MIFRIIFLVIALLVGIWFGTSLFEPPVSWVAGVAFALASAAVAWALDFFLTKFTFGSILGLAAGLGVASLLFLAFYLVLQGLVGDEGYVRLLVPGVFLVLIYLGAVIGAVKGGEVDSGGIMGASNGQVRTKILDTSVIIDGRIADVAEAGFIDGDLIIPKFIIQELQYIADSTDPIKRVRGRRGLDVLRHMQQEIEGISVRITDDDFPRIKEADLKLVALAEQLQGTVITNDYNLNKVADLHEIKVLNLNQLANALKPVVLPGETMNIYVVKEGKEENQGIGYLDDGTMVVVDDARTFVGKNADVSVTSVLQTPTGRMIFSKIKDERERDRDRKRYN